MPTNNKKKGYLKLSHFVQKKSLLKQVICGKIEGRIKVTGRGERRRKRLLDGLRKETGHWKLEGKALYHTQ